MTNEKMTDSKKISTSPEFTVIGDQIVQSGTFAGGGEGSPTKIAKGFYKS